MVPIIVLEQLYVDGIVSFGWNNYSLDRVIGYNLAAQMSGRVGQIAHADPNGYQSSFSIGAGYDFRQGAWTFGPVARLQYIRLNIDVVS